MNAWPLPAELTIYHAADLHRDWLGRLAALDRDGAAAPAALDATPLLQRCGRVAGCAGRAGADSRRRSRRMKAARGDEIDIAFFAEALPAFLSEAEEQVRALEDLLLQLEDQPGDRELLNALFRCVHTVKGSAGLFGLDDLVGFTHHMETLLSCLREGELALTPALSTLLLRCNDQVRWLVAEAGGRTPDADAAAQRAGLAQALQHALPGAGAAAPTPPHPAEAATKAAAVLRRWRVQAKFGADTFRDRMDPLTIVQYLLGLGTPVAESLELDAVPLMPNFVRGVINLRAAVVSVIDIPAAQIERPPNFGTKVKRDFIRGVGKVGTRFDIILEPDRAFDVAEMAEICASSQGQPSSPEPLAA
jgi:HPt (histidine-containing phosphotransfer) domain-containing protein